MSNSEKTKASPAFVADFTKVTKHFCCTPSEIEIMKACARNDMANATISFAEMAKEMAE